jgi:hypothetical protein
MGGKAIHALASVVGLLLVAAFAAGRAALGDGRVAEIRQ